MSGRTKYFFDQFVSAANHNVLHPLDWRRFYTFIHAAHQGRARVSEEDVRLRLVDAGFEDEHAIAVANIYRHGRGLLKRKPAFAYIALKASGFKTSRFTKPRTDERIDE